MHRLVPPSLLAGRWVVVLVCYLDDSGTDKGNRLVTIAGYAATDEQWRAFEAEVEPTFAKYGVDILHAVELEHSSGFFKGWTVLKKQSFVAQICGILLRHVPRGLSMSALKWKYKERAVESQRKRTVTPYTFCAGTLLNWVMTDLRLGKIANADGFSLIFECGNRNNAEAQQYLQGLRPTFPDLDAAFRSISFVQKRQCRAIQMADLMAYYTRRHGAAMEIATPDEMVRLRDSPNDAMMKIIREGLAIRSQVATDFGPKSGSAFLAGDPE